MCPNNLRTKNSALMRGLSKIIWSLQLQIIQDTICQILLSNGLQLFCISTLAFFLSGPHNLFLLWEKKLKNHARKATTSCSRTGQPQTASACFSVFVYIGNRCCVHAPAEIKDTEHLQMSGDTCGSFHCCLSLVDALKRVSEALFWQSNYWGGAKRGKKPTKKKGVGETFTLGKLIFNPL